jgi:hypothetical protein
MPPFLYRCHNTGDNVQAWAADDRKTVTSLMFRRRALRAPSRIWSTRRTNVLGSEMTIRSYFQFDTRSRLRCFFASSEGWSSLNKR